MTNFKKFTCLALSGLMLVGCGSKSTDDAAPAEGAASAEGSTVVVAFDADLNTMDHEIATDGNSFIMQSMMYSGLTSLDAAGSPVEELASWDVSEDGLVYTFHIKDEAKWADGTPVTAADFVYGWQRLADPATASEYAFILSTVHMVNADAVNAGELPLDELGAKAIDEKTLEVTLDLPCDFFLGLLAFPSFFPLQQAFYEAQGDQFALSTENLLACGPYEMTGWVQGNEYTFTKRADYFNVDPASAETVVFKFIQDTQSAMLAYQQGDIDVVKLQGEQVDMYKDEPGYTSRMQGYLWYLSLCFNNEYIQNKNVRAALHYAIDRDAIGADVLKDGSIGAKGEIPVGLATSPTGNDYRDEAEVLTAYDPAKALEYAEAAVAEIGSDIELELLFEDSEASKAVAENIQAMVATNCGGHITLTLNSKPKKTRLQIMNAHEHTIGLTRWGPDYADPQTYMDLFVSTNTSNNSGLFNSPEYDELVEKGTKGEDAANSEARWADLMAAEKILVAEEYGVIPVYQNGGAMMINPAVTGIAFHSAAVDDYRHVSKAE